MDINQDMSDLLQAYDKARLCALHIDLQDMCYFDDPDDIPTDRAFKVANDFAQTLRGFAIDNYWVAIEYKKPEIFPYAQALKNNQRLFQESISVLPNEITVTKSSSNAFGNEYLTQTLYETGQKTQLYTGVYYDACFQATLKGALSHGFRAYACLDATDCPEKERNLFKERFFKSIKPEVLDRLTVTTTTEVVSSLHHYRAHGLSV